MDIIFYILINGRYYRFIVYLINHLRQHDLWQKVILKWMRQNQIDCIPISCKKKSEYCKI